MRSSRLTLLTAFLLSFSVADVSFGQNGNGEPTGNGAPCGPHYNLNIIGMSKDKNAEMIGTMNTASSCDWGLGSPMPRCEPE